MQKKFPTAPDFAVPLLATRPSPEARALLALRRSASSRGLMSPGPSSEEVDQLLEIAARVPDHRRLEPWRFIVFEGAARAKFGAEIARLYKEYNPEAGTKALAEEENRPLRAPLVITVVFSPDRQHKTPLWEQKLSCGAVCQNLLLAANASGWAGVWLTEWVAYDTNIAGVLGLDEGEQIAGFIYIGTPRFSPNERKRPDMAQKITRFQTGQP